MKITMQNNDKKVELEVDLNELKGWLSIELVDGESEETLQKRIQSEIDEKFNKPDHKNWRRHNRHIGYSKAKYEDGEESFDHFKEPLIDEVRDSRIFFKDEIERDTKEEYEECLTRLSKHIKKPDLLDLLVKYVFEDYTLREIAMLQNPRKDDMSEKEYLRLIAKEENNLSHKWRRLCKKLEKIILETSDFNVPRGYLVEDKSSKKL